MLCAVNQTALSEANKIRKKGNQCVAIIRVQIVLESRARIRDFSGFDFDHVNRKYHFIASRDILACKKLTKTRHKD